jgi:hypothetical protein
MYGGIPAYLLTIHCQTCRPFDDHSHWSKLQGTDYQLNQLAVAGGLTFETPKVDVNRHRLLGNAGTRICWLIEPTGERAAFGIGVSVL